MDIKNTLEVMEFANSLMKDLAAAKADDGKISVVEAVSASLGNASAGIAAVMDSDQIGAELSDLDAAEIKKLAEAGIELAKTVMSLMKK
jgi:hypothetical protein